MSNLPTVIDLSAPATVSCPACAAHIDFVSSSDGRPRIRHAGRGCDWWNTDLADRWIQCLLAEVAALPVPASKIGEGTS